jgi:hypothetical protein
MPVLPQTALHVAVVLEHALPSAQHPVPLVMLQLLKLVGGCWGAGGVLVLPALALLPLTVPLLPLGGCW